MGSLKLRTKFGYGAGHVLNDLCSAMWFSYLIIFFHHVLMFENAYAGLLIFIGQIADALSTPFIGHEADRTDDLLFCIRYGRRKTWHLIGTVLVICSYPFVFFGCLGCSQASPFAQIFYFAPFAVIFQFGWASTQISHLALLPNLTPDPDERTELNAIRYAFTVISTITVYCVTWLIFGLKTSKPETVMGPQDIFKFREIVVTIIIIGIVFSIAFHVLVKEGNQEMVVSESDRWSSAASFMTWKDWAKEPQFYMVALLYMSTRLFCNLSQVYIPIYLQDTLVLDEQAIAYIPLMVYVSGFFTTFPMKYLNKVLGRKVTYLIGCLLGLAGAIWVYFGSGAIYRQYLLYAVAFLFGCGGSTMLVTSLSLTADLIGSNVESGGFVYGAMSFTDKLSNGLVVMVIQSFTPPIADCQACKGYFRLVITFACGGAAICALISILILWSQKIGVRRNQGAARSIQKRTVEISPDDDLEGEERRSQNYSPISQSDQDALIST